MFGENEILVPACQLVGQPGITREPPGKPVHYIHILLDHHAVIFAQVAPSETLFLGAQIHENLSPREISLLQQHLPRGSASSMQPARLFVRGGRLKKLLERLCANNKPLLDATADVAASGAARAG